MFSFFTFIITSGPHGFAYLEPASNDKNRGIATNNTNLISDNNSTISDDSATPTPFLMIEANVCVFDYESLMELGITVQTQMPSAMLALVAMNSSELQLPGETADVLRTLISMDADVIVIVAYRQNDTARKSFQVRNMARSMLRSETIYLPMSSILIEPESQIVQPLSNVDSLERKPPLERSVHGLVAKNLRKRLHSFTDYVRRLKAHTCLVRAYLRVIADRQHDGIEHILEHPNKYSIFESCGLSSEASGERNQHDVAKYRSFFTRNSADDLLASLEKCVNDVCNAQLLDDILIQDQYKGNADVLRSNENASGLEPQDLPPRFIDEPAWVVEVNEFDPIVLSPSDTSKGAESVNGSTPTFVDWIYSYPRTIRSVLTGTTNLFSHIFSDSAKGTKNRRSFGAQAADLRPYRRSTTKATSGQTVSATSNHKQKPVARPDNGKGWLSSLFSSDPDSVEKTKPNKYRINLKDGTKKNSKKPTQIEKSTTKSDQKTRNDDGSKFVDAILDWICSDRAPASMKTEQNGDKKSHSNSKQITKPTSQLQSTKSLDKKASDDNASKLGDIFASLYQFVYTAGGSNHGSEPKVNKYRVNKKQTIKDSEAIKGTKPGNVPLTGKKDPRKKEETKFRKASLSVDEITNWFKNTIKSLTSSDNRPKEKKCLYRKSCNNEKKFDHKKTETKSRKNPKLPKEFALNAKDINKKAKLVEKDDDSSSSSESSEEDSEERMIDDDDDDEDQWKDISIEEIKETKKVYWKTGWRKYYTTMVNGVKDIKKKFEASLAVNAEEINRKPTLYRKQKSEAAKKQKTEATKNKKRVDSNPTAKTDKHDSKEWKLENCKYRKSCIPPLTKTAHRVKGNNRTGIFEQITTMLFPAHSEESVVSSRYRNKEQKPSNKAHKFEESKEPAHLKQGTGKAKTDASPEQPGSQSSSYCKYRKSCNEAVKPSTAKPTKPKETHSAPAKAKESKKKLPMECKYRKSCAAATTESTPRKPKPIVIKSVTKKSIKPDKKDGHCRYRKSC